MISTKLTRLRKHDRLLFFLGLFALAVTALMILRSYLNSAPSKATISAGNVEGLRHRLLLSLGRRSEWSRLRIEPILSSGTIEMLERIEAGELDFGLIQGGFDVSRFVDIRQVAGLGIEPLQLLVKEEIHEKVTRDLKTLKGLTIDLGSDEKSGTFWLSREVLAFAGLPFGAYRSAHWSFTQVKTESDRAKLPDAVFVASPLPNELAELLIVNRKFRLVPLPFGEAFRLGALTPADAGLKSDREIVVREEHIPDASIPSYTYQVSPPIPDQPTQTLGTRVLVVCHRRTNEEKVIRLIETILASPHVKALHSTLDESIVRTPPEFPWHAGAIAFRRRNESFVTSQLLAEIANTFTVLVPLTGTLFLFWKRFRGRLRASAELNLDHLVDRVVEIEGQALAAAINQPTETESLKTLLRDLTLIKAKALDKLASHDIDERERMGDFLTQVGDARMFVNHLRLLALEAARGGQNLEDPAERRPEADPGSPSG